SPPAAAGAASAPRARPASWTAPTPMSTAGARPAPAAAATRAPMSWPPPGPNGIEHFYATLSGYPVSAGTRVRAGQLVAYNGQTGNARYTAPHVHFEVHPGGGAPVNPYPYLRRVCG